MGKNHRHKKNLKADKAKVKLKRDKTKFLPKGSNETKPSFKIKPLVLLEQSSGKDKGKSLSTKKSNIQDICSRLNHHNENVRYSACEELVGFFKCCTKENFNENLSEVTLNVSNLMQDRERKVRMAAVKIVAKILETVPSEQLKTFSEYFSRNLCCAMTNINEDIQDDSLKFLDCFLNNHCELVYEVAGKIFPDFFTLISKFSAENEIGHTLVTNLGRKVTNVTWRIRILGRLQTILDIILKQRYEVIDYSISVNAKSVHTVPIYKSKFLKALQTGLKTDIMDRHILDNHLSQIIPVLCDIWLEVVPDRKICNSPTEATPLDIDSAAILSGIVNTLYLLWKYIDKEQNENFNFETIFKSLRMIKFFNALFDKFPYVINENSTKIKNKIKSDNLFNINLNCVKENIIICHIYFMLNTNLNRSSARNEMQSISAYVNKCLIRKNHIDQNSINIMIDFINLCLVEKCFVWKKFNISASLILENVLIFYNSGNADKKNKIKLFKLIAQFMDNPYLSKSQHYLSWLSALPTLLCKSHITNVVIDTLLELARKNCTHFLNAVRSNMLQILNNLNSSSVILESSSNKTVDYMKMEIGYIFYYMGDISCIQLKWLIQTFLKQIPEDTWKERIHKCGSECSSK